MLDGKLITKIQELNSKGLSISHIAKELNISRATVRKYLSIHDSRMEINDTEDNPSPDEEYNPPAPSSFSPDPKTKAQWAYWEFREAQSKQKKADLKKDERSLLNELLITILRLKYTAQDQASTVHLIHNIEISPDLKKHALKWGNIFLALKRDYETIEKCISSEETNREVLLKMFSGLQDLQRQWYGHFTSDGTQKDSLLDEEMRIFEKALALIEMLLKTV